MGRRNLYIGASANDGTGLPLRDAFDLTNQNFEELFNITSGNSADILSISVSDQSRVTITGLTGGTASDLDGVTTVGVDVNLVREVLLPGPSLSRYILVAGTDAESSPDVIRPDDYAASTNEKVWKWAL